MIPVASEKEGTAVVVLHNGKVISRMAADRLVRPPPLRNATVIEGMAHPIFDRSEFDPLGHSVSGTTMDGTDQRQHPVDRGPTGDGHVSRNSWPNARSRSTYILHIPIRREGLGSGGTWIVGHPTGPART